MKKWILKMSHLAMVMVLLCGLMVNSSALTVDTARKDDALTLGKQMVLDYIEKRENDYYDVKNIDLESYNEALSSEQMSFDIVATIMHELKADHAEELPFVQGMMSALDDKGAIALLDADEAEENVYIQKIDEIQDRVNETTTLNLYFNVIVNLKNAGVITSDDIVIYALDSSDNKVDLTEYDIPSYKEMFDRGYSTAKTLWNMDGNLSRAGATKISNYANYDRIAARDYAYEWWGPNASDYNPAYSNWANSGGDCANFVSQCIAAGGVPTDKEWYKDSSAWISTSALSSYMVRKGYATKESYKDTTAGNFATKPGHSVLVTLNNTVDICYTAHTTNRKDAPFTKTELNSTYTFYVIKNY